MLVQKSMLSVDFYHCDMHRNIEIQVTLRHVAGEHVVRLQEDLLGVSLGDWNIFVCG
jgi:hypothetical protein